MVCSVSTGKSSSSWLDRLRTAKGFADDCPTDLENFLQNPPKPLNPEMLDPTPIPASICGPTRNEDKQLFNIMSNVLNELFNFGDNRSNSTKLTKSARKQKYPRICAPSVNGIPERENAASDMVTLLRSCDSERVKGLDKCENEGRDVNLVGFSRTEVTIIDTSYKSWKFEKFLYRKKNLWKVRDKKVKRESVVSKKKRKLGGGFEEDSGKKSKVDKNERNVVECELPLNEINISELQEKAAKEGTLRKKQSGL
ncbi:hypothetical protein OROGR_016105 [Orobanche gracilis]